MGKGVLLHSYGFGFCMLHPRSIDANPPENVRGFSTDAGFQWIQKF
jgi:hypothetical protein